MYYCFIQYKPYKIFFLQKVKKVKQCRNNFNVGTLDRKKLKVRRKNSKGKKSKGKNSKGKFKGKKIKGKKFKGEIQREKNQRGK